jgi:hypothetical protein
MALFREWEVLAVGVVAPVPLQVMAFPALLVERHCESSAQQPLPITEQLQVVAVVGAVA